MISFNFDLSCKKKRFYFSDKRSLANHGDKPCDILRVYSDNCIYRSSESMYARASAAVYAGRTRTVDSSTRFIPGRAPEGVWSGPNLEKDQRKRELNLAIAGLNAVPHSQTYWMARWLRNSREDGLVDTGLISAANLWPSGAPLIDFLAVSANSDSGWAYPSAETVGWWRRHRGLPSDFPRSIKIKELTIGEASSEEVRRLTSWIHERYEADQSLCPSRVLSFDTEMTRCTEEDWIKMKEEGATDVILQRTLKKGDVIDVDGRPVKNKWRNLPTKIFWGDGLTWAAVINLPCRRLDNKVVFSAKKVTKEWAKLFNSLPVLTGLSVSEDVFITEQVIELLTSEPIDMSSVDIGPLATLAGYDGPLNMTVLGITLLGAAYNKSVSRADDKWDIPFGNLPQPLQGYMIGDLRFGHLAFNTVFACLMRELFADPEPPARYTRTSQAGFLGGFAERILIPTITGVEVYTPAKDAARTREELMKSLRYRTPPLWKKGKGKLKDCPRRVIAFITLLNGKIATIAYGGARYLHHVRYHFIYQHEVLHLSRLAPEMFPVPLTLENKAHLTFNRGGLDSVAWEVGVNPDLQLIPENPMVLTVPPELYGLVADPHLALLSADDVYPAFKSYSDDSEHSLRFTIMEWARFNPLYRIPWFIDHFDAQYRFFKHFKGYYSTLASMYVFATGRDPLPVPERMVIHAGSRRKLVQREEDKLAQMAEAYAQQKVVVETLHDPWHNLDSDEIKIPLIPMPRSAGVPKPKRVKRNRGTKGRDLSEIVTDHAFQLGTDEIARTRPWASQVGVIADGNGILVNRAYNDPAVYPVLGPVLRMESDEEQPGPSCKRIRLDGDDLTVTLAQDDEADGNDWPAVAEPDLPQAGGEVAVDVADGDPWLPAAEPAVEPAVEAAVGELRSSPARDPPEDIMEVADEYLLLDDPDCLLNWD